MDASKGNNYYPYLHPFFILSIMKRVKSTLTRSMLSYRLEGARLI